MNINQYSPEAAWDLLFPQYLSMLSDINQDTMGRAIRNSTHIWIGDVDGEIFGFWGLIPPTFLSDSAYLWFYNTEHFCKHVFRFIRHSREVTAQLLQHFPLLIGHGRIDDRRSLRWLQWCGAEFGEPQGQLLPFTIRAS